MKGYIRDDRSFASNLQKRDISPKPYNHNSQSRFSQHHELNRTTTSVHSEHLWNTLQELELFPAELSQLLRNEDRNISLFKSRIQRQKNKVGQDIDSYKKQMLHYVDDFKLSLMAELDNIYKAYMERYAKLKGEVLEIKRLRDQIEFEIANRGQNITNFASSLNGSNFKASRLSHINSGGSNINTIKSIESGLKDMKKYHILNYISELQKSKIAPVSEDAKSLIILTQYQNGYYQAKQLGRVLNVQKDELKFGLRGLFQNKHDFVRDVQLIIGKQRQARGMLEDLNQNQEMRKDLELAERQRQRQRDRQTHLQRQREQRQWQRQKERQRQDLQRQKQWQLQQEKQRFKEQEYNQQQPYGNKVRSVPQYQPNFNPTSVNPNRQQPIDQDIPISPSNQTAVFSWLQNPKITLAQEITVKPQFTGNSSDIILCALLLPNDQIVIGGKDGQLVVYHILSGEKVCTLKGHQASVCSLALVNSRAQGVQYLASGSDHGCSCILLWQLPSMTLRHKLEGHKAAVTAIVDLLDGQSIVSGSYDKKINIYNLKTGKVSYNLPTNKSSVTGIVLNNNATKMVSCGLDNSLNVWQIIRSQHSNNAVETLFLQRIIQNNAMICSIVGSMLHEDIIFIGTKDGKVKIIDIEKGQSYQTITCCNNAIIEMVVLERQSHPNHPIIAAWPCKEECFKMVDTENGKIQNVQAKGHIQFGCGIGPKGLFLSKNGKGFIGMLSQSANRKQVNFYRVQTS